jgi:hypothetical protein
MTLELSWQSFEKYSNIKFRDNPSGGSEFVPCGRADKHDEADSEFWPILRTYLNKNDQFIAVGRSTPNPGTFGLYRSILTVAQVNKIPFSQHKNLIFKITLDDSCVGQTGCLPHKTDRYKRACSELVYISSKYYRSLFQNYPRVDILSHCRFKQTGRCTGHDVYRRDGAILLEKLTCSQLVKKFPTLYGTRRSITAFTTSRHLSISWARSIQFLPPIPLH